MEQEINAYNISANQELTNTDINDSLFSNIDFGPLKQYLDDDNITDISYSNNGQVWLKSLDKGVYRVDNPGIDNELMEKIAFQCANIMGKVFNMASPFLDSESAELRMNFVHDSIARNGIAAVFRKTPAKIRLKKEKLLQEKYITNGIHDFLIKCVKGHCNIMVAGETGSGKTELVKYLASHTNENEKLITIEDTLELHLDRIFPHRDIVAMKTNNIASYSDVLVTCMRQNPKWILLSEVRSAEAVTAVRNSISSGHNVLSTIHADKAQSIPHRMYSLLESNIDVEQFMTTIYRYIQLGIYVRARYDKERGFMREVAEVTEFYVDENNKPQFNVIYHKNVDGTEKTNEPSKYLVEYLLNQGVDLNDDSLVEEIDYDALDDLAKTDKLLEQEKKEKKKEEEYINNFGTEPIEEEKEEVKKGVPKIDVSLLKKEETPVIEEIKDEPQISVSNDDLSSLKVAMTDAGSSNDKQVSVSNDDIETLKSVINPSDAKEEEKLFSDDDVSSLASIIKPNIESVGNKEEKPTPTDEIKEETLFSEDDVSSLASIIQPNIATQDTAKVETSSEEASGINEDSYAEYENNLYNYDYSQSSSQSNPIDLEKTQYLDSVNNTGNNV